MEKYVQKEEKCMKNADKTSRWCKKANKAIIL